MLFSVSMLRYRGRVQWLVIMPCCVYWPSIYCILPFQIITSSFSIYCVCTGCSLIPISFKAVHRVGGRFSLIVKLLLNPVQPLTNYSLIFPKPPAPVPKKTVRQKSAIIREKSLDLPDRHRQEARRRLMAAKRAASFRQNSASERADSIEIYIPEAQTRL